MLAAPVRRFDAPVDARARPPGPGDVSAIVELLRVARRGTIDDEGEAPTELPRLVAMLFAGDFGPLLWAASEVLEERGCLVSTTLLTRWLGSPFVAFCATAPEQQRRGYARAGMQRAFNRLAVSGEPWLHLLVTDGNARAEALYASLGFVAVPQPPFTAA